MPETPYRDSRLSAYGGSILDAVPPISGANNALQKILAVARLTRPDLTIEIDSARRIVWHISSDSQVKMTVGGVRHDASGPVWRDAPDFYLVGPMASIAEALRYIVPLHRHLSTNGA